MLEWTGERFIPGVGAEIAYEHYGRYLFASRFVASKQVLDMPSGEGFGSFLLAQTAHSVVGIDIDAQSLQHARTRYQHSALNFQWGDMAEAIAFPDGSFDVITCFEGIEHIDQTGQHKVIREFKRLLAAGGMLFISTPNKAVYTDAQNFHNPYHIHEFYFEEFHKFLSSVFPYIRLLGQMSITGGLIESFDEYGSQSARKIDIDFVLPFDRNILSTLWADPRKWMYFIAVCMKEPSSPGLSMISHLVADPGRSSIFQALDSEKQQLTAAHLAEKSAALAQQEAVLADKDRALGHLQATLHETEATLAQKNDDLTVQRFALEDKDRLIAAYEAERRTFGAQVGRLLSRQRNAWAPPPSPQGKMLGLMIRAARLLHREGVISLIRKASRAGLHRVNPQRWPAVDWLHSSGLFDTSFYLMQNPDVAQAGVDPLWHYVTIGWKEGRDPHPLFDTAFYLAHNPDVAQAGVPPLLHYISYGWQEGRAPHCLFDTRFYLAWYPDVRRSGRNPLQHFITQGWKEEHDPHPLFDMNFYLESHPDIRAQNINPAIHYASVIKTQRAYNSAYQKSPFPPYVRPRVPRIPHTVRVVIGAVTYNNASAEYAQYRDSLLLATRELSERHSFSFPYIDNGTESHLSSMDAQFVQLPSRGNIGFGTAHNDMLVYAFQAQNADLYICANPDGVFHRFCLRHLIDMHAQFPNALIEARQFPEEHPKYYHPTKLDTHWASGCCLLIPRAIYQAVGGYDPHFFLYMEDVDYSWRARLAGLHVKMCPNALFGHHVLGRPESTSTKRHFFESGRYLAWKWGNHAFQKSCETALIQDKYYNCYSELPSFPPELKMALTPQEQEEICAFDKGFSFSYARW